MLRRADRDLPATSSHPAPGPAKLSITLLLVVGIPLPVSTHVETNVTWHAGVSMTESDGKGLTVPKFSSFKPPAPVLNVSTHVSTESNEDTSDKTSKRHKDGTSHRHRRHDRREDRDRSSRHRHDHRSGNPSAHASKSRRDRNERSLEHLPDKRLSDKHRLDRASEIRHRHRSRSPAQDKLALVRAQPGSQPDAAPAGDAQFIIDQRGDPLISRYRRNDRSKVPQYRRNGRGRLLGSDGYLSIHIDAMDEEFSIRRPGQGTSALKDRHLFAKVRHTKPRRIRVRKDATASSGEEDFVPLSQAKNRGHEHDASASEDEAMVYRSIEGKAKAHQYSDSELEYDSSDAGELRFDDDDPARKKSIELSRRVKEHPNDIEAWLALISHQDVLLQNIQDSGGEATEAEVRSFAEIKLSMYESALQAQSADHEEQLLLGMMLEGAKTWPASKLHRRLLDVVQQHPTSFVLWKERIDSMLTNMTVFQFQELKDAYQERLLSLPGLQKYPVSPFPGASQGTDVQALHEQVIYVFLRMTRFVYDTGYRELAVAAWQAVLELNLNRPLTLSDASSTEVMDQFKDFWESEVPRIGEDSAQGWAHYVQQDGLLDAPDPVAHPIHRSKSRNVYQAWGATEHVQGQQARLPARSMDEGVDDDPYRVVIFSDLENLIFCVPGALITALRKQLVDAFLLFCHLPPADGSNGWIKAAMNDPHVVGSLHGLRSELLRKPAQHNPDEDDAKRLPIFDYDAHQLRASFDCVFASQSWFKYFAGWPTRDKNLGGPVPLSWTANAVRQVVNTAAAESLAQYSLALDWINDPANVKKRARALLKQFPRDLRLYLAYALAEERNGNLDVARQVLVSSAGLAKAPSTDSESKLVFWTTWSWMELEAGQRASAILCLCALADGSAMPDPEVTITPHQLLITQQTLRGNLGYNTPASEAESTALNAGALILCEYLTVGGGSESASLMQGNISTAMDRVWSVSEGLSKCGFAGQAAHEVLLQSAARLLYFHARQGPFRSAYLREQLAKCLGIFPRNTMFLSLFAWASSSFGIDDPVGDMLRSTALANQNDCVSSRIFAINYELQRGNSHSTRAAFEQALKSPACRANSELWRCYVQFSHSRKELRAKAKDNFFRGLGQCPWSKDLAMEAFTTLTNVMDEFELGSVFNTMQSKGLRLHVELDEFLAAQGRETGRR